MPPEAYKWEHRCRFMQKCPAWIVLLTLFGQVWHSHTAAPLPIQSHREMLETKRLRHTIIIVSFVPINRNVFTNMELIYKGSKLFYVSNDSLISAPCSKSISQIIKWTILSPKDFFSIWNWDWTGSTVNYPSHSPPPQHPKKKRQISALWHTFKHFPFATAAQTTHTLVPSLQGTFTSLFQFAPIPALSSCVRLICHNTRALKLCHRWECEMCSRPRQSNQTRPLKVTSAVNMPPPPPPNPPPPRPSPSAPPAFFLPPFCTEQTESKGDLCVCDFGPSPCRASSRHCNDHLDENGSFNSRPGFIPVFLLPPPSCHPPISRWATSFPYVFSLSWAFYLCFFP